MHLEIFLASMDFKKFAKSSGNISILDYKLLKGMEIAFQGYQLKSLRRDDVLTLFSWRNIASDSLLPDHPLSNKDEDPFLTSIKANLLQPNPDSIHLRLDHADGLLGIAGFTEINWQSLHAKTYFFLDPKKSGDPALFGRFCSIILHLLMRCAFISVGLDKISIETPGSAIMLVHTIEASGFKREAEFKDYAQINGHNVSMIYATCVKEDYLRVFPNP